jgi:hypothetical protein
LFHIVPLCGHFGLKASVPPSPESGGERGVRAPGSHIHVMHVVQTRLLQCWHKRVCETCLVGGCFELAVGDAAVEILASVINFSAGSSAYKKLAQWEPAL